MMDLLHGLGLGFATAVTPLNILYCLIGVSIGTLIGVLPGIGPVATIAMLLPITFSVDPVAAMIMLSGIYYGAQYGGSTSAILINAPGESSAVVTCLEGYQMARNGRAGPALAIAAIGSFVAGTIATLVLAAFAPMLTKVAINFGAPEYFSLMVLGLVSSSVMAHGSLTKALGMVVVGLILGLVGVDQTSGTQRFTFGLSELSDGLGFVVVAVGLFGLTEIILTLEKSEARDVLNVPVGRLMPSRSDFLRSWKPILRGSALGSVLGVLPGGGAMLSSFASYAIEKKLSGGREFGHGAIEGVAGPESANNAGAQTSFVPLLTLGIPSNPVMALMIGALMIQGIQPGPDVISSRPELFWGIIASMWIGNLLLLILNLPLVGIWVRLLSIPYRVLYPAIFIFACIGVYSISNSAFDVLVAAIFGVLGCVFVKLKCEPTPLVLGFVLGPLLEENMRRSMIISSGDPLIFFSKPVSCALLVASFALLMLVLIPGLNEKRNQAFQE